MSVFSSSAPSVGRRVSSPKRSHLGTVLVTGASSGIGAATTRRLAARGFHVLAGVRNLGDADPLLEGTDLVEPIQLDITDRDAVAAFAERMDREPAGLTALVNNAGTISVGPIEVVGEDRWEEVVRVNVLGTISVTRAAIPALVRARGRVVNVSSPNGRIALPMFGPYAVSKFALEAFNDTLRREVAHLGVRVVCVAPGPVSTPIFDKGLEEARWMIETAEPAMRQRYRSMFGPAIDAAEETKRNGHTPDEAAQVITRALTAARPRTRYPMGPENRMAAILSRLLPDRALDALIARIAIDASANGPAR